VTTLRVVWPIVDPTVPAAQIAAEVREDLPGIAAAPARAVALRPYRRATPGTLRQEQQA
jgi:hypothetical protein